MKSMEGPMSDDGRLSATPEAAVERLRAFNRFYTRRLDLLDRGFLASPYTLGEVRLMWELSRRPRAAADLTRDLGIDPGQLSRALKRFEAAGLVTRLRDPDDARRSLVDLTDHGRAVFAPLEAEQRRRVAADLDGLTPEATGRLVDALCDVERLLEPGRPELPLVIRPHRTGDIAFVLARQARLYAEDYGFDQRFEALICEVGAAFLRDYDPRRDASFIAEIDGRLVGAVFLTRWEDGYAKIRLLHVESEMRGRGIGTRLVDACIRFAREAGYRAVTLWTNDVLVEARRLYARAGFRMVAAEPHSRFGPPLVGETWELML
jgi:DNA-binding MarR family transcriptional regulator/GNAT superfamily N-acetyltransferase